MLEHINDDLELIKRIGKDKTLIASVPNFDSRGHVRHFADMSDVLLRYSRVLNITDISKVKLGDYSQELYVFKGKVV